LTVVAELNEDELDKLIERAVVDAYGDDEQMVGFYTMINDNLALPFTTGTPRPHARVV
jgi:Calcium binding